MFKERYSMIQEKIKPATTYLTQDEALAIYRDMILGRVFEDRCAQMYYQGKMFGFVHLYTGQEAVSSGIISQLGPLDYVSSTYRDHVHALSKQVPARAIMAELFGKATGCSRGRGGSMHLFSAEHRLLGGYAFVAEGIPIATGSAFKSKYLKEVLNDPQRMEVTACFFGDGASNNGAFFESMNMAALWKLPILFVCENNLWSIGMAHNRASSVHDIHKKALAFDIPGVQVDGMDVLAVHKVAKEAIERARAGEGPTLIEALTYRFRGHSLADPDGRSKEERELWRKQDPIPKFQHFLYEQGMATELELKTIDREIELAIDDAVQFALDSPEPPVDEIYRFIHAEDE
jgi:pyruvate dehydrogenase E1 component alpha subunit